MLKDSSEVEATSKQIEVHLQKTWATDLYLKVLQSPTSWVHSAALLETHPLGMYFDILDVNVVVVDVVVVVTHVVVCTAVLLVFLTNPESTDIVDFRHS